MSGCTCSSTTSLPQMVLAFLLAVALLPLSRAYPLSDQSDQNAGRVVQRPKNYSRVLIVGAGAAGVAAASRLMENGFYDLTVLEAENRIGGRINTVRFAENVVELGAEWVHGEAGNVVFEMAEPLDLLGHQNKNLDSNMAFVWSGGALADANEMKTLLNASHAIRDAGTHDQLGNYTGSYGEWFLDQFSQRLLTMERRPPAELVDRFLGWFEKATGFYDGSDTWFNTSGKGLTNYKECAGDLAVTWKRGGYRSVFDLLTKRFPNPALELPVRQRVQLHSEVSAIRWADRVYANQRREVAEDTNTVAEDMQTVTESMQSVTEDMRAVAEDTNAATEDMQTVTENMQTVTEDMQTVTEDIQTVTEDMQTVTEDMQTVTEDMQTVTEDMQTVTEDMQTVTEDMQTVTEDMQTVTEDMQTVSEDMNTVTEDMNSVTEDLPQGDDPVARPSRARTPLAPVIVELSNGARYTADIVLVTVSLGVLKHSGVLFDPPLPRRKMNAVQNLGFGQVNKLFLYFAEPWWPSSLSGFSVLVTEDDLSEFKRKYPQYGNMGHWVHGLSGFYVDQHKPNVVLMDWVVGQPARNMERYSDYQVMMGCVRWLEMFLGQNYSIPLPVGFTRSKWWSNPHFRGSYSYRSLDSERANAWAADLAEPILDEQGVPAVLFAGEATHDHYYSTVHGAIETGWREADRILQYVRSEGRAANAA